MWFQQDGADDVWFQQDDADDVWFQQEGATLHTSQRSLGILQGMFPSHGISLRGDIWWPPRPPDLDPYDFFLIGLRQII